MSRSSNLYELIQNLSRSEKRYFKLFAATHKEGSHLVRLFDKLAKQSSYDEDAVKKLFRGTAYEKQFHVLKNRLYKLILKSMTLYNREKTRTGIVHGMLEEIGFLRDKGLNQQAYHVVKKAKAYTLRHEMHLELLETLKHERQIALKIVDREYLTQEPEHLLGQEKAVLKEYENYCDYASWGLRAFLLWTEGHRSQNKIKEEGFREMLAHDLYTGPEQAQSFQAKYLYHVSAAIAHLALGEPEKALVIRKSLVDLMAALPADRLPKGGESYCFAILNYLMQAIRLREYEAVLPGIQQMRQIPAKTEAVRAMIASTSHYIELMYYNAVGSFEEAVRLIPEIERLMQVHAKAIDPYTNVWFHFQFFSANLGAGQLSSALKHLNETMQHPMLAKIPDINAAALLGMIILHFEMDNWDLLESLCRSSDRFFKKREGPFPLEALLLKFFKDLTAQPLAGDQLPLRFKTFKESLFEIMEDAEVHFETGGLGAFDFLSWLNSKIERRDFGDIVRERARKVQP